jgi:predicted DNA-binding transcriptional regulator YafY
MSQMERVYWIDGEIRAGRFPNAEKVVARFEVSKRLAYSDRAYLLNRLHAPLVPNKEHNGWTYSNFDWMLPFLALSESEAATMRRSLLVLEEYLSPADAAVAGQLFNRLSPDLCKGLTTETLSGAIHLLPRAQPPRQLLADCRQAIRYAQRLHLRYYSIRHDQVTERIIHPYHLHTFSGEAHLIAWCETRQAIRQFFLGRFRTYEVLPEEAAFVRQAGFDAEVYLRQGLTLLHGGERVTIRARFTPYQARWIREREYHSTQQLEELPDGGLIVTLQVGGTEEARRWLMSFGSEVEVLEPAELRAEIIEELQKLQKIYHPPSQ